MEIPEEREDGPKAAAQIYTIDSSHIDRCHEFLINSLAGSRLRPEMWDAFGFKRPESVTNFRDDAGQKLLPAYKMWFGKGPNDWLIRVDREDNKYVGPKGKTPPVFFFSTSDPDNPRAAFKKSKVKATLEGGKTGLLFALATGNPVACITGVSMWAESASAMVKEGEEAADYEGIRTEILELMNPGDDMIVGFDGDWRDNDQVGGELAAFSSELKAHGLNPICVDFGYRKVFPMDPDSPEVRMGYDDWFAARHDMDWCVGDTLTPQQAQAEVFDLEAVPMELLEANEKWALSSVERYMQGGSHFTHHGAATRFVQLYGKDNFHYLPKLKEWAFWDPGVNRWIRSDVVPGEISVIVALHYQRRARVLRDIAGRIEAREVANAKREAHRELTDDEVKKVKSKVAKLAAGARAKATSAWADALESEDNIGKVFKALSRRTSQRISHKVFDSQEGVLACANGVIDMDTGELRPERQSDYISKRCAATYWGPNEDDVLYRTTDLVDEGGAAIRARREGAHKAKQFLREFTALADGTPAPDRERYLRVRHGSGSRGRNVNKGMEFCTGLGNNAKSTFAGLHKAMFGDYGRDLDVKYFTQNARDAGPEQARSQLAQAAGCRWVYAREFQKNSYFNEAFLKELTGGEEVAARNLYTSAFDMLVTFTPLATTNYMPHVSHIDPATVERLGVYPCLRTWVSDHPLQDQTAGEQADTWFLHRMRDDPDARSYMLWWVVAGSVDWIDAQRKLPPVPEDVKAAMTEYVEKEDDLAEWFDWAGLMVTGNPKDRIERTLAYNSWCDFRAITRRSDKNISAKAFYEAVENGTKKRVRSFESSGKRYLIGMRFLTTEERGHRAEGAPSQKI